MNTKFCAAEGMRKASLAFKIGQVTKVTIIDFDEMTKKLFKLQLKQLF